MKQDRATASGFSLVELLVALLVLVVGILAMSAEVHTMARQLRLSYLETRVQAKAQDAIERFLVTPLSAAGAGVSHSEELEVEWEVMGEGLWKVRAVAQGRLGDLEVSDTLGTLVLDRR